MTRMTAGLRGDVQFNKYTYIHTYINTYIHTYIHTYICMCNLINTYIHTYIHAYIHTVFVTSIIDPPLLGRINASGIE